MSHIAAIFDVDGTLVRANVVDYYLFLVRGSSTRGEKVRRFACALAHAPYWMILDRIDRARFNRSFYRSYRGIEGSSSPRTAALALACFEEVQSRRLIPETLERLECHRDRGDKIVLVSGSLDFLLRPLAEHVRADACISPSLVEEEGSFSGELAGEPVIGEEKARRVLHYAGENDIDLSRSYAYADSVSDLAVLRLVGHPAVVEPGRRLRDIAFSNGWDIIVGKGRKNGGRIHAGL